MRQCTVRKNSVTVHSDAQLGPRSPIIDYMYITRTKSSIMTAASKAEKHFGEVVRWIRYGVPKDTRFHMETHEVRARIKQDAMVHKSLVHTCEEQKKR